MENHILFITYTSIYICLFLNQIILILKNIKILKKYNGLILIFYNQILQFFKFTFLHKILKAVKLIIADYIIYNYTNTKLLIANVQKKLKA